MDSTHLHLLVNHVPILGTLFALLLGLAGAFTRKPDLVRAAFATLLVCGAASFVATRTGEGAEDLVEALPGVSEAILHDHEEAAERANVAAILLGLGALAALVAWRSGPIPRWGAAVVLIAAATVFGLMAQTGNLGGQVRHTEIRAGGASGVRLAPTAVHREDDD